MPNALSCPPLRTDAERIAIYDSFPDDPSSHSSTHYADPCGSTLSNVVLTNIPSNVSRHGNALTIAAVFSTVQPVPPLDTETGYPVQQAFYPIMFPFVA